jgi:hypothetical protein
MLSENLRNARLESLWSRVNDPGSEREALVNLAVVAWLSFLLWVLLLVRPFNLLNYYYYSQLNLYGFSWVNPSARWDLVIAFVGQGVLYYAGWRAARRAAGRDAWAIVAWSTVAFIVALLFVYPLGSTDIFDYILHGRIVGLYHANPFVQVGYDYPKDPVFPYMGWPGATSAYGPLWELLAGLVARVAAGLSAGNTVVGNVIVANVIAFKLLSGIFLGGCAALVAAILRFAPARQGPAGSQRLPSGNRALAGFVLIAWNPLILYETLVNGHNDVVMVFCILLAAWALLKQHFTLAILALVAGTLLKFIPVLLLPAAGLIALRDLPDWRERGRFLAVTALLAAALVVLTWKPFWEGPAVLGLARRQQLFTASLSSVLYAWLTPVLGAARAGILIARAAAYFTVVFALFEGYRAWRDRNWTSFASASFAVLMFYVLGTVLWFMPWYAIWPLGLAPLLPSVRSVRLAHVFGFTTLFQPVVAVPLILWGNAPPPGWQQLALTVAFSAMPWLYILLGRLGPANRRLATDVGLDHEEAKATE